MFSSTLIYGVTYHGSVPEPLNGLDNVYGKHISADRLRSHLTWLKERYPIVSLIDSLRKVRQGRRPPRQAVFIVFHDGYRDNYDVAYPILKEMGLPASFFLTTAFIGTGKRFWVDLLDAAVKYSPRDRIEVETRTSQETLRLDSIPARYDAGVKLRNTLKPLADSIFQDRFDRLIAALGFDFPDQIPKLGDHENCLDWDMVREMSAGGMEFGSHTHGHIICARQDEATTRQEMTVSKEIIERETGKPCEIFCYPNGYYPQDGNEQTDRLAKDVGYDYVLYMVGPYNLINCNSFKITGLAMGDGDGIDVLERTLSLRRYLSRRLKGSNIWPWSKDSLT
ncbi:polysaccharide deacetylase family protein [bacterium]|nr:polysaccharide deacetylase family protein [bacterium]